MPAPASVARAAGRLARGAGAVLVLGGLLAGLPWLLATQIGWPLPRRLPTLDQATAALTRPLDDARILDVLAVAAWILWANFIRDVLLAVLAAAGRRTPRSRAAPARSGPVRALASVLVGAIAGALAVALLRGTTTPAVSAEPAPIHGPGPHPTTATATAQGVPTPPAAVFTTPDTPAAPPAMRPAIRRAALTGPAPYALAAAAAASTGNTPGPGSTYVVREGDNLWTIAETQLRNPWRWREIYTLNRGHRQANGHALTDPDEIHIGWTLALPPRITPPAPATPPRAPATPEPPPDTPKPRAPQPPDRTSPAPTDPTRDHRPGDDRGVSIPTGGWVTTGLATAVAATVAAAALHRRRRAHRRWPIPATLTPDPPPHPARIDVLAAAGYRRPHLDPDDAPEASGAAPAADTALAASPAAIGVTADGDPVPLAQVLSTGLAVTGPGARAAGRAVLAAALTSGTAADPRDRVRVLAARSTVYDLLTDGHPPEHHRAGSQDVSGEPHQDGLDHEALDLPPDPDIALARFEQEMIFRCRLLDSYDVPTVDDLEAADDHADNLPLLVLVHPAHAPDHAARIRAVLIHGTALRLGALLLGAPARTVTYLVQPGGRVTSALELDQIAAPTMTGGRLATLTPADLRDILQLARAAAWRPDEPDTPDQAPDPADKPSPLTGEDTDQYTSPLSTPGSHAAVRLELLGEPALTTPDGTAVPRVRRDSYAVLALLAVHPDGRTLDQIADALHPDIDPTAAKQRARTACTSLRTALRNASGLHAEKFLLHEQGRYRLDTALIDIDLWRMLSAIDTANHAADDAAGLAALQQAADAYRGEYAAGIDRTWADQHRDTYRRRAQDALGRIAELAETDHPDQAIAALEQAIEHDPYNEETYQHLMRIQGRLGRTDAVRRTLQHCENRLADLDAEPAETTRRLAARQVQSTQANSARGS